MVPFIRDRTLGTTERISIATGGTAGNGGSVLPSMSTDGRYIVYYSGSTNLVAGDTNAQNDVFLRDRQLATTERLSVNASGMQGDKESRDPEISADGRFVLFSSVATNLVAGDTNAVQDVFLRDRVTNTIERVSISSTGAQGDQNSAARPDVTADGRLVVFWSAATTLVGGDTNGVADVFTRERNDTFLPSAPGSLDSISHDRGFATSNRTLAMRWTPGTDPGGAVTGYSWALNNSGSQWADTTRDLSATSLTTTIPGNGEWWFHVRTVDQAGNVSADRAFGPITINNAAISLPKIPLGSTPEGSCQPGGRIACTARPDALLNLPIETPDAYRSLYGYQGPYYAPVVPGSTVTVLDSTVSTASVVGKWHAWGLVRNETAGAVGQVTVKAKLFDGTNQLLGQVTAPVPVRPLRPNEPGPFALVSSVSHYKVARVEYSVTTSAATTDTRKLRLSTYGQEQYGTRTRIAESSYSDPAVTPFPHLTSGGMTNEETVAALLNPGVVGAWLNAAGKIIWVQTAPVVDPNGTPVTTLLPKDIGDFYLPVSDTKAGPKLSAEATTLLLWGTTR